MTEAVDTAGGATVTTPETGRGQLPVEVRSLENVFIEIFPDLSACIPRRRGQGMGVSQRLSRSNFENDFNLVYLRDRLNETPMLQSGEEPKPEVEGEWERVITKHNDRSLSINVKRRGVSEGDGKVHVFFDRQELADGLLIERVEIDRGDADTGESLRLVLEDGRYSVKIGYAEGGKHVEMDAAFQDQSADGVVSLPKVNSKVVPVK